MGWIVYEGSRKGDRCKMQSKGCEHKAAPWVRNEFNSIRENQSQEQIKT